MIEINKHIIDSSANIRVAFQKLNELPNTLTLFVTNLAGKLLGTLTDGDIRRGFLKGLDLSDNVEKFMSQPFHFLNDEEVGPERIREIKKKGIRMLPVLNKEGKINGVIDLGKVITLLPLDVVLMAGGRGERLRPLTDIIPKPLLPVAEKSIIEHLIDHLISYGIKNYKVAIRYMGEMIEEKLGDGRNKDIRIEYIREKKAMGTIGSVSQINYFQHEIILVMNADLFTNIDLEEFYYAFQKEKADLAVATIPYTVDIPYAVMNYEENVITGLHEKPSYTYHSNAGIYLVNKKLFGLIPSDKNYNTTDLIQAAVEGGYKVIRFPIIGYWIDIGRPEDYQKVKEIAKHLNK